MICPGDQPKNLHTHIQYPKLIVSNLVYICYIGTNNSIELDSIIPVGRLHCCVMHMETKQGYTNKCKTKLGIFSMSRDYNKSTETSCWDKTQLNNWVYAI